MERLKKVKYIKQTDVEKLTEALEIHIIFSPYNDIEYVNALICPSCHKIHSDKDVYFNCPHI